MISFVIPGLPAPQGSKSAIMGRDGQIRVIEGGSTKGKREYRQWRRAVKAASESAVELYASDVEFPLDEPIAVSLSFLLPVVASDKYRSYASTKPDLDKLVRSTLDGMAEGGLMIEDSRVVDLTACKEHAPEGREIGCAVNLIPLGASEKSFRENRKAVAAQARRHPEPPLF